MRDHARLARGFLASAGGAFAILAADIIIAKVQVVMGASIPVHIGDTGQFLVLLLAVSLFVVGAILREKEADGERGGRGERTDEAPPADRA